MLFRSGNVIAIPNELKIPNTFIVRGGLTVDYFPITTYTMTRTTAGKTGIPMGEQYYLRPRTSPVINCADC